jgi:hypothetical protein
MLRGLGWVCSDRCQIESCEIVCALKICQIGAGSGLPIATLVGRDSWATIRDLAIRDSDCFASTGCLVEAPSLLIEPHKNHIRHRASNSSCHLEFEGPSDDHKDVYRSTPRLSADPDTPILSKPRRSRRSCNETTAPWLEAEILEVAPVITSPPRARGF